MAVCTRTRTSFPPRRCDRFKPNIQCYLSWLWCSFVPHFGGNNDTFIKIPDAGMPVPLEDLTLEAVPAHYLHSSGNFHLYDKKAKSFSPAMSAQRSCRRAKTTFTSITSINFIRHAAGFHADGWDRTSESQVLRESRRMEIDMLCPSTARFTGATT